MSSPSSSPLNETIQQHTSFFGIPVWLLILSCSFILTLFLLLVVLFLCIRSFCRRGKTYEPRFCLSNPLAIKNSRDGIASSSGRRLLSFNASDIEMDVSNRKHELDTMWSSPRKSLMARMSLGSHVEAVWPQATAGWGAGRCEFTLEEIERATKGFDAGNVIGYGEIGIVYLGLLQNNTRVAVKPIPVNSYKDQELKREADVVADIRHRNVVKLLGYCIRGNYGFLVHEYVDNGNLQQWLHGCSGKVSPVTWDKRMNIIRGTAKGLAYLHEDIHPKVVHGSLKSSNILLDQQWNPKISDVGFRILSGFGHSPVKTHHSLPGCQATADDATANVPTEKSDVYCFGILIMEIISGRPPVDESQPQVYLIDWIKSMVANKQIAHVVDPKLPEIPSPKELKWVLLIALGCVDPDLNQRPTMGNVIHMLKARNLLLKYEENQTMQNFSTAQEFRKTKGCCDGCR